MDDKVDERAGVSLAKMTVAVGVTSENIITQIVAKQFMS